VDPDQNPNPLDPHDFGPPASGQDPSVRGMDPAPDPYITNQKRKKNIDSYCIVTLFNFFLSK